MASVRALAEELRSAHERIDVLANNAGALFASREVTSEGFERTFALNQLAPFLLTNLLLERLAGGRVVTTASDAHTGGRLDLDNLQSEGSYSAMRVYGTSKLCNILFTRELARREPELRANCFHPGVVRTGFGKNENGIWKLLTTIGAPFFRSPERGARSLVWLATSEEAGDADGRVHRGREGRPAEPSGSGRRFRARALGAQRRPGRAAGRRGRLGGPGGGRPLDEAFFADLHPHSGYGAAEKRCRYTPGGYNGSYAEHTAHTRVLRDQGTAALAPEADRRPGARDRGDGRGRALLHRRADSDQRGPGRARQGRARAARRPRAPLRGPGRRRGDAGAS